MSTNLPPSITVNRNLASTLRNFIKAQGGKNVNETEMNAILQKVAKFDAERDAGTREGGSIFDGGHKYLGGSGNDFQVKQGQEIQLSAAEFNEIFKGYLAAIEEQPSATPPGKLSDKPVAPKGDTKPSEIPDTLDKPNGTQALETEAILDSVDGKVLEREVNGQKTKISVATVNGEKVRREIKEDGSLGDTLVTVSTAGKNKYITQTEMDNRMRTALGLEDNAEIPKDIKGSFVSIGGEPTLIFKKDGKTMDQAQLREYVSQLHSKDSDVQQAQVNTNTNLSQTGEVNDKSNDEMAKALGNPENWTTQTAHAGESAPVTGPKEGENPEYDAAVRGEGKTVNAETTNPLNDIKDAEPVALNRDNSPVKEAPVVDSPKQNNNNIEDNTFRGRNGEKIIISDNTFEIDDDVLGKVSIDRAKVKEYINSKPSPMAFFNRASAAPHYRKPSGEYKIAGEISFRQSYAMTFAQTYASKGLYNDNEIYIQLSQKPAEQLTEDEKDFMQQHEAAIAHFIVSTEQPNL